MMATMRRGIRRNNVFCAWYHLILSYIYWFMATLVVIGSFSLFMIYLAHTIMDGITAYKNNSSTISSLLEYKEETAGCISPPMFKITGASGDKCGINEIDHWRCHEPMLAFCHWNPRNKFIRQNFNNLCQKCLMFKLSSIKWRSYC